MKPASTLEQVAVVLLHVHTLEPVLVDSKIRQAFLAQLAIFKMRISYKALMQGPDKFDGLCKEISYATN